MLISLANRNIIITGASSGIGRATALLCAHLGARVILVGRNQERLAETHKLLDRPGDHLQTAVDLTAYDDVERKLKPIFEEMGLIDGLVNCAGVSTTLPLRMIKSEKLDYYFQNNVHSALLLTKLICNPKYLSKNGASVIFLSSVMGVVGESGKVLYSLTKGALVSGAKSLALELAPKNVRVNCISPGVVETPMSKDAVYSHNEESRERIEKLHPLGLGQPEDIANACAFLLSDASRWITGTNLVVDGGYTAR